MIWQPDAPSDHLRRERKESFPDLIGLMALLAVLAVGAIVFAR